jgi:hypothetical protein
MVHSLVRVLALIIFKLLVAAAAVLLVMLEVVEPVAC